MAPIILWMRRDLRLTDNPAMDWAAAQGRPVIPVWIRDEVVETWGAAPTFRVGLGLDVLGRDLEAIGSRLVLRRGRALDVLRALVAETGADTVTWNRLYVKDERARDTGVKEALRADGVEATSHHGHVMFEPWTVETGSGGFYKVFTPFWKAVRGRDLEPPTGPVDALQAPGEWPASDALGDWDMGRAMRRGAEVVGAHVHVGEEAARDRLVAFLHGPVEDYAAARNMLSVDGTSGLSENLTYGEISIRECWFAGLKARGEGDDGAETFLKELAWRDFAHHLAYHTPRLVDANWKPDWDTFPWRGDNDQAEAWRRGRTGIAVVDAAMREMQVTGRMHNRSRMLVASYLTKHLMTHWKIGCDWFADSLIDWDPASNAMGWQWAAGSGPDAAPFFRIFNPDTQAEKFDPKGAYRDRWLAELTPPGSTDPLAASYFDAIPKRWEMAADDAYPKAPVVGLAEGRARALEAYAQRGEAA